MHCLQCPNSTFSKAILYRQALRSKHQLTLELTTAITLKTPSLHQLGYAQLDFLFPQKHTVST